MKMKNVYEKSICFKDAELACEVMDWLNEHNIDIKVSMDDEDGRRYWITLNASRIQMCEVERYLEVL